MSSRTAVVLAVLAALAGPAPARAGTASCGGFAPTVTRCATGTWTRESVLAHDVAADFNYVGTVESALEWSGGTRFFRCTYFAVFAPRTCLASGEFPPVGATFTHRCRSLVPGTVVSPAPGLDLEGVEGGAGTWQCSVTV